MNYQKKLDLLIERALSNIVQSKKTMISEQDPPPSKGGFVFTPEPPEIITPTNTTKTKVKPKTVKKVVKTDVEKPETAVLKDTSTTWQPPAKDSTAYEKALEQKVQKYYDKDNPEHNDAWNGVMVYGTLLGLGTFLLGKGYFKYKAITDPEWGQTSGFWRNMYGQPFWPGWIRWFGGQKLKDLQDLKKFLNIERERGNITQTVYDDFIRELNKSQQFIMRAKTFNQEIKAVKSGQQTMRQLIKKLPSAYRNDKNFVDALLKYDDEVLSYGRAGGRRVVRGKAGELKSTGTKYASWYSNLSNDLKQVDWPSFQQEFGNKFGQYPTFQNPGEAWPFGNIEGLRQEEQLEVMLRKATRSGDPIPLSDYGIQKLNLDRTQGRFLGPDGKLAGQGTTIKPAVTVNIHSFSSSTILRNLETTTKNNVPCIEFHLKFQTGGKEDLKKFLMSDEMTTIAGEKYSSAEANAIIKKLESDGTNIVLPKKYTDPGASIPDMTQWTADMKEIGLRAIYRNDANRKRQVAYAEIYKILRKGL